MLEFSAVYGLSIDPKHTLYSFNLMLEFSAVHGLSIDPKHTMISLFLAIEFKKITSSNLKIIIQGCGPPSCKSVRVYNLSKKSHNVKFIEF